MLTKKQLQEISKEKRLNPVHGNIYQLKLLMLFLYRGVSNQYSFLLATEVKEAGKFDDLVFQYIEDGKIKYRLLQAKHKLDESKKITLDDLLGKNDNNYNLAKYFFSYRDAKKSKLFQDGIIENVIICTNIGLDLLDLKRNGIEVKNIEGLDCVLDIKNSASKRYGFNQGLISKLKPILDKNLKHGNLISDEEIQDFLNHLVFAINQPNEEELGKIIKDEIGEDLDLVTTENTYNKFFITMLRWLQGKERGRFLSYEEGKEFFEEAKRGLPILFNVRDPVSSFTGRIEQLDNLHKAMMDGGRAIVSQSVSISGLGGVGKSELARKYIREYSQDYDNKVIWINAENQNTLSESFRRLACDKLGISLKNRDGKEKDIKSIVEDVYRFFSKGKSLFVFDNAEKYRSQREDDDGIDKFLPSLPENMNKPHILVTSRNKIWPQNVKLLELDVFTLKEAIEFIQKALKLENNEQQQDVIKLAERLQYLPLALQQAVAYIKVKNEELKNLGSGFSVDDYLKRYEEKTRELLDFQFPEDSDNTYTKTALAAWKITLDSIKQIENGDKAIEIMNIIAYFAPDNISTKMFFSLISNKEDLGSAIKLLKQYSMVSSSHERTALNVHRLVQQVTRINLKEQELEVLNKTLRLLTDDVIQSNVNHALYVWNYASKYDKLVRGFSKLPYKVVIALSADARYEEGCFFGGQAFKLLSRKLGSDHLDTLTTLYHKATVLLQHSKYNEALLDYNETYNKRKSILGPDHPDTLTTLNDIGLVFEKQGKHDKALSIHDDVCKRRRDILGPDHPHTLVSLHNTAFTLESTGKYDEALLLYKKVYNKKKNILGSDHESTLTTLNSIAGILLDKGKHDKALYLYTEIYDKKKNILGHNHPDTLIIQSNIGLVLSRQRKYDKALQAYQEVLNIQKRPDVLGSEHPNTLTTQHNIAGLLFDQRKYDEALRAFNEVYNKRKNILGPDHPDTLTTKQTIEVLKTLTTNVDFQTHKGGFSRREDDRITLHSAINDDDIKAVISLLDKGADITQVTAEKGNTVLHISSSKGNNEIIKLLLEYARQLSPAKFNYFINVKTTTKGSTALHVASERGNLYAVRLLLENGTIYNTQNKDNKAPLELTKDNELKKLFYLVENLFESVKRGNHQQAFKCLKEEKAIVNARDNDGGGTPLYWAVHNGHMNTAQLLLENGADPTLVTNKGNTPLHIASNKGNTKAVKILLAHVKNKYSDKLGQFINTQTTAGETSALHIASNIEVTRSLLQYGAVYNIKNKEGKTPLDLAKNDDIRKLLSFTNELFEGVKKGNLQIISKLRSLKADDFIAVTNARNYQGHTLLQVAIASKQRDIATELSKMLKNLAPSSSMESVNVAGPRSCGNLPL
ncbi:FxSxx-COOH system tetratricopeptide repeat protein [Wolbachia endosymbiont of Tetranychus urticae]|uniref:FxSxx-COOH system tetratricopeptide repeat protein n=1 Tax=Wolbachia endosymbiont of Tetranychus urticae TaxID=169184 RepID=UPI00397BFFAB